jgi:hypothetical protein
LEAVTTQLHQYNSSRSSTDRTAVAAGGKGDEGPAAVVLGAVRDQLEGLRTTTIMIAVLSDELKGIKVPLTSPRAADLTPTSSSSSSTAAAAAATAAAAAAPEPVKSDISTAGFDQQKQQQQQQEVEGSFAVVTPDKAAVAPSAKAPPSTPYSLSEADAAAATWAELQRRIKAGSGN